MRIYLCKRSQFGQTVNLGGVHHTFAKNDGSIDVDEKTGRALLKRYEGILWDGVRKKEVIKEPTDEDLKKSNEVLRLEAAIDKQKNLVQDYRDERDELRIENKELREAFQKCLDTQVDEEVKSEEIVSKTVSTEEKIASIEDIKEETTSTEENIEKDENVQSEDQKIDDGLDDKSFQELKDVCTKMTFPIEEWEKMKSKKQLRTYIIDKTK